MVRRQGDPDRLCVKCKQPPKLPAGCSSVRQVVQEVGVDPVIFDLVQQRLQRDGPQLCQVHQQTQAIVVCEDCAEFYCEQCRFLHSRQRVTKDHLQRRLPSAPPETPSQSDADDPESRGESRGAPLDDETRQWLQNEVKLLQQASREKRAVISTLTEAMGVVERLASQADQQRELLHNYMNTLSNCQVTHQIDDHTVVLRRGLDGASMTVDMEEMERHVMELTEASTPSESSMAALQEISARLSDMLAKRQDQ